jgi:mono/diheme cytochrome c family protein
VTRALARAAACALAALLAGACRGGKARHADVPGDTLVRPATAETTHVDSLARADSALADSNHADSARAESPPTTISAADSAAGDAIFHGRGRCFTCHGANAAGQGALGPSLVDSAWVDTDGTLAGIAGIVRSGVASPRGASGPMPAYASALGDREIEQVSAYVYALSHRGAVTADTTHRADSTALHH